MVVVTIVVLGDIGRSPRMQYHTATLATQGYECQIVGYEGSKPIKEITDNKKITIKTLRDCPPFHNYVPRLIAYILKTLWQVITLLFCFMFMKRSHFILVQTPPAIPALAVCWLYCVMHNSIYVIDWHNYGFTNMAVTLGEQHKLVRISNWFEGYFGRKANFNFCVTKAMRKDLKQRWDITSTIVLYDRPFDSFSSTPLHFKHAFFKKLSKQYPVFATTTNSENSTVFTSCLPNGLIALKQSRPALLVSSTSWTEDEDFSILLSALKEYNSTVTELPNLICVITGKGPLKDYYNKLINDYNWKRVTIITPWLEPEDYPVMLGSADLGVCLHTSTSGLDLPMKVVDMFGCGLPVAAYKFQALSELVEDGKNGIVFTTSQELAEHLIEWFKDFPNDQERHNCFRKNIEQNFQNLRWHENWVQHAQPIFQCNFMDVIKKS
ncbi:ALG1, chitobiosyldiphosphodolichol beta-mannosyltransferase [Lycorma delicatula]|uniref:ALG1, chitobiosyldiphosphodolichol beta-mannosyltransferase n=1 Tax=Lycorma delicatula TaxID=130591 RepID=UPI003F50F78B